MTIKLINIISAAATVNSNRLDLTILADLDDGLGEQEYPFTYDVDDESGLTPEVSAWFASNPDFAVGPYVEPDPPAEIDPTTLPITAIQLRLAMVRNGISLDAVTAAIAAIPDSQARDEAAIYWEFATEIHWDHPQTQALMALMGVSEESARVMWAAALTY